MYFFGICFILYAVYRLFKDYSTLGVRYRDLQARVDKQGTRNLTVLNFEFLVCKRVLVNTITHERRVLQTF